MLEAIQQFFAERIDPGHRSIKRADPRKLQIATGALFIEMTRMDEKTTGDELQMIRESLQTRFDLTQEETRDLLELAEAEASEAIDYYQFTSLIKTGFSQEQKEKVIENLWMVSMSDGDVDEREEYFVRKIAGLIGVPHEAFIAAKLRARIQIKMRARH
jgi:uncharacterized tellurite resistance protein B-like protein